MVNPIALTMMALGVLLLLLGIFLMVKRMKMAGIVISLLGVSAIATPFLVSSYLATSLP